MTTWNDVKLKRNLFASPFSRSTIWWSCQPTGPTWRVPPPRTITRTSRPRTTRIWRLRRGPRRARTPPTHKDKLPLCNHPSPPHVSRHPFRHQATPPPTPRPPAVKTPTLVMFDSPTASPFSILFLSTKSCGEENRGWGEAAGPNGGRCFRTWEIGPRRSSSGTTQRFGSVSSYVLLGGDPWNVARLWWLRALSQYSLSTPLHTHTQIKNIQIVHCLPQPQWPNFPVFWCFICIYIWTWIYCANVYKCFFKYARNSFDLSSSLYFLSWIPPLNFVLHLELSVVDAQFIVALQQSWENENSSCPISLNMTQIMWYLIEFCAFTWF